MALLLLPGNQKTKELDAYQKEVQGFLQ